ncbi:MAG TPA: prepilin-type N-terminal cleavage/methylation domain-containing protein [Usitatibacter sp.]|nr:prepilin-type N-terminal cleavage/methylation domain-containing protein [Usitatibacter sp.]
MRRASQAGFTLVELVIAVSLLAVMMVLLYSGLTFAFRSWDAGELNGRREADRRLGENFLRRELTELFPMRWKDPMTLKFALDGQRQTLRFVSSRPADVTMGGLSLVGLAVEPGPGRTSNLVMRRAMPDDRALDFGPLDNGTATVLLEDVDSVAFSYFGSDNDMSDPRWSDTWTQPRIPQLIRMIVRNSDGTMLPTMTFRVELGAEAGCLENSFQRVCSPRRTGP